MPTASWPDLWVDEETFTELPMFKAQLTWFGRVLKRFPSPALQQVTWDLQKSWLDHDERREQDVRRCERTLDDRPLAESPSPPLPGSPVSPDSQSAVMTHAGSQLSLATEMAQTDAPSLRTPRVPLPPRPLCVPCEGVNLRQFLTYVCLGSSPLDGLSRALSVIGTDGGVSTAELHAVLLQLGGRPTPPCDGNGTPPYPSLAQFSEALEESAGDRWTAESFAAHAQGGRLLDTFGRNHCRLELENFCPKVRPRA